MRVLVLTSRTADDRKTIAAVRALDKEGLHVTVGADRRWTPARWSRSCRDTIMYSDPAADIQRFADQLLDHVARLEFDVLLPLCDYTTAGLARNQDRFKKHAAIAVPEEAARARAQDKLEVSAIAKRLGMLAPDTWAVDSKDCAAGLIGRLSYPCVVKFRKGAGGAGLRFPCTPDELLTCFDELGSLNDAVFDNTRLLVQEYIPGETHDVCALFCRGEPRAVLSQKRLRMYPREGGIGVYTETTDAPELKALAITLLRELRWHGPAQVEFRVDSRDGRPRIIEVNTRFWGTLDLAIQAGVNFPLLTCTMAAEGDVRPVSSYRVGLKYRWPVPYGVILLCKYPGRRRTLSDLLLPKAHVLSDIRILDPVPNLMQALAALGSLGGRSNFLPRMPGTP